MKYDKFPLKFNEQNNKELNDQIEKATSYHQETLALIEASRLIEPRGKLDYVKTWSGYGLAIGFGCYFLLCSFVDFQYFDVGIILSVIICAAIGIVKWKSDWFAYETQNKEIEQKIWDDKYEYQQEIERIQKEAINAQQDYLSQFEKETQRISVQLAESQLAKRVIEWMTDGFCRTIDAADRRKHIEQISVPFQFEVYTNKITCNLGTFDFEIERCENLNGPLEQTALARAIASSIQLNIVMKYPKDASGTDIQIKIDYQYSDKCPKTTITYVAPNGYYEAVQKW